MCSVRALLLSMFQIAARSLCTKENELGKKVLGTSGEHIIDNDRLRKVVLDLEAFDAGEQVAPDMSAILQEVREYYLFRHRYLRGLSSEVDDKYMPSGSFPHDEAIDEMAQEAQEYFTNWSATASIRNGARPLTRNDYVELGCLCRCEYLGYQTHPDATPLPHLIPPTFFVALETIGWMSSWWYDGRNVFDEYVYNAYGQTTGGANTTPSQTTQRRH